MFSLAACGGTNNDVDVDEPGSEVSEDVVSKVGMVYGDDEPPLLLPSLMMQSLLLLAMIPSIQEIW